jgi:hypothetical protein
MTRCRIVKNYIIRFYAETLAKIAISLSAGIAEMRAKGIGAAANCPYFLAGGGTRPMR